MMVLARSALDAGMGTSLRAESLFRPSRSVERCLVTMNAQYGITNVEKHTSDQR